MNVAGPIRTAIIANAPIVALLGTYEREPAVLTRRPVPDGATYPMVVVSPDLAIANADFLVSEMPIVFRELAVYGQNPKQYRDVEQVGYLLRKLFHQKRFSISVPGFHVIEVSVTGPIPAPTDDDKHMGRAVTLAIQLQDLAT